MDFRQRKQYRKLLIEDIRIVKPVHQPLCVMGIEKIEQHIVVLLHIHSITAVDHVLKLFFVHRTVQKEVVDTAHKRIIHNRIILVARQQHAI